MGAGRTNTKSGWKQWKPKQARSALEAWRASGLTLAAYARRRGVTTQRLRWWRERLGEWRDAPAAGEEVRLVPAILASSLTTAVTAVTVRLSGEVVLEISDAGAVPPEWVVAVAGKLSRVL